MFVLHFTTLRDQSRHAICLPVDRSGLPVGPGHLDGKSILSTAGEAKLPG